MKTLRNLSFARCLVAALLAGSAMSQAESEAPRFKLRPDHDSIAALRSNGPTVNGVKLEARQPGEIRESRTTSFLKSSTLLAFNGHWTLVPKRAVIHIPEALQSRIVTKPSGKLLPWTEFLALNRGWLHTQNVAMSDARGETELSPAVCEAYRATGRVVVAVHQRGPISMPTPTVAKK